VWDDAKSFAESLVHDGRASKIDERPCIKW